MALVESITLAHTDPSTTLYAALFKDVTNAPFIRSQLLAGNTDFDYAFVDASTILSTTHIFAAAFRALNDQAHTRLRTRNVHSEIVFSLSPNNNISTALTTFGITPTSTSLLVLKVSTPSHPTTLESVTAHLTASIAGTSVPFTTAELRRLTSLDTVKRLYKLNSNESATRKAGKGGRRAERNGAVVGGVGALADGELKGDEEDERRELEVLVLGMMALKGS